MRTAGEGEDAHACRARGIDAGGAVLDDNAIRRIDAHVAGGMQEKIGRRFASRYHGGTVYMRFEHFQQAGERQRQADTVGMA